jgi:hypothetical protein
LALIPICADVIVGPHLRPRQRHNFQHPVKRWEIPLSRQRVCCYTFRKTSYRRELVFMPQRGPLPGPEDLSGRLDKRSFNHARVPVSRRNHWRNKSAVSGRRPQPECRHLCRRLYACRPVSTR